MYYLPPLGRSSWVFPYIGPSPGHVTYLSSNQCKCITYLLWEDLPEYVHTLVLHLVMWPIFHPISVMYYLPPLGRSSWVFPYIGPSPGHVTYLSSNQCKCITYLLWEDLPEYVHTLVLHLVMWPIFHPISVNVLLTSFGKIFLSISIHWSFTWSCDLSFIQSV